MSSQWGSQKLLQCVSWTHSLPFWLITLFRLNKMAISSKARKPEKFESQNSLKLSFTNIRGQPSYFVGCEYPPWIKLSWCPCFIWNKTEKLIRFKQYLCKGLSSFNSKGFCYSYTWPCNLCNAETRFCAGIIFRKLWGFLFMFLTGFTSFGVLLPFPIRITIFFFVQGFWCYII